jgi:uncharacterized coiled-coil protein SlyX
MKTRAIKVVKRNEKVGAENTQSAAKPLKSESTAQEKVVDTLNKWIAERRENGFAERADFNNKLLKWKTT